MEKKKWDKGEKIAKLAAELANVCMSAYEETIKTDPEILPYLFKASSIGVQIAEASYGDAGKTAKLIFEFAQNIYEAYHHERIRKLIEEKRSKDSPSSSDTPDKAQGDGR